MNASAADFVSWKGIQNKNSGKLLAVHNQSLDDGAHVQQYNNNGTQDHLWRLGTVRRMWSERDGQ